MSKKNLRRISISPEEKKLLKELSEQDPAFRDSLFISIGAYLTSMLVYVALDIEKVFEVTKQYKGTMTLKSKITPAEVVDLIVEKRLKERH